MSGWWIAALVAGLAVIAGLSFYLGRLLMMIRQGEQKRAAKVTERNNTLGESIHTIAWAMRDGQCEFSEGCLRIWVLLDHIEQQDKPDQTELYPGVFSLYDKIKDQPTHDARKKYKKKEIMKMDKDRWGWEKEFKEQIEADIGKLIERFGPHSP